MAAFFCKLVPPRPTFGRDMTSQEAKLMQDHAAHWMARLTQGVVVFGFVDDPAGGYGVGIVEFPDEPAVRAFTDTDPVIKAQAGFRYEILSMPLGAAHSGALP